MQRLFFFLLFIACGVFADQDELTFRDGWARATVPGVSATAVYGIFENEGEGTLEVTSISSRVASRISIHRTVQRDDMMRMERVQGLRVPGGGVVELKPGGLHMMLTGLKQPLNEGDTFTIIIRTDAGREYPAEITVGSVTQGKMPK